MGVEVIVLVEVDVITDVVMLVVIEEMDVAEELLAEEDVPTAPAEVEVEPVDDATVVEGDPQP